MLKLHALKEGRSRKIAKIADTWNLLDKPIGYKDTEKSNP